MIKPVFQFRIHPALLAQVEALAEAGETSKSNIVTAALIAGLPKIREQVEVYLKAQEVPDGNS